MPIENQTRRCAHRGCKGTQTYSATAAPPGYHAGVKTESGAIAWGAVKRVPAWVCSVDRDHFDRVDSN